MLGHRVTKARSVVLAHREDDGTVVADPAIDIEASDIKAYWDSNFDEQHLVLKNGEEPTRFTIAQLNRPQKEAIDAMPGARVISSWYMRASVLAITNYEITDDAGEQMQVPLPDRKDQGKFGEMASEKWTNDLNLPQEYGTTLFLMINHLSEARVPLSKLSPRPSGDGGN